jgi:cytoskeleton protein RodZ
VASNAAPASAAATASGTSASAPTATPTPTAASDEARVYGAVGESSRIVVNVTQDCWVQIRDGDRILIDKVLHPGESYRVGDRTGLIMDVGNAVGLAIEVDGHKTPPISGTVRHDIALDAARLVAGTAAPK